MATTQTLQEAYWPDAAQEQRDELEATTRVRYYTVPKSTYDTLKPSVADTYYGDSNQIVALVERVNITEGEENVYMAVTYVQVSNAGFSSGYAQTRKVGDDRHHDRMFSVFGIALADDSAGIPGLGDALSGESGTFKAVCNGVELDDQQYPGLYVVRARYQGSLAYT